MQTAGRGIQTQPQLGGSSRGKEKKIQQTDWDFMHRRTGKAAPAQPGDT